MARKLTINQTYHVDGYNVEAQLNPNNKIANLVLWVRDGDSYRRLGFFRQDGAWRLASGEHVHEAAFVAWVNKHHDTLCTGLV